VPVGGPYIAGYSKRGVLGSSCLFPRKRLERYHHFQLLHRYTLLGLHRQAEIQSTFGVTRVQSATAVPAAMSNGGRVQRLRSNQARGWFRPNDKWCRTCTDGRRVLADHPRVMAVRSRFRGDVPRGTEHLRNHLRGLAGGPLSPAARRRSRRGDDGKAIKEASFAQLGGDCAHGVARRAAQKGGGQDHRYFKLGAFLEWGLADGLAR